MTTATIESYLSHKWVHYHKSGKEIVAYCIFNDCDEDSHGKEAHLYIDDSNGCYQCKKCLEQGNWVTLLKHFGDNLSDYPLLGYESPRRLEQTSTKKQTVRLTDKDITKYQNAIPENIREYLNGRGITNEIITERQLGYGSFYGSNWITIPIRDMQWKFQFFKLRRDPFGPEGTKYMFYPTGSEAMIYGAENLENNNDYIIICEWEFDQMVLAREWLFGVTSTGGVGTFKEEWIPYFSSLSKIYICFDTDEAWEKWAEKLINRLSVRFPEKEIYKVSLPKGMGKDISEYIGNGGVMDDIVSKYSEMIRGIDVSKFPPLKWEDIIRILWLTIKHDNMNKLVVFLAMLSAYTDKSQFNILLNAPSSSGKTYIPIEIAKYFPPESIMDLLYVSQNAFFHENGEYDKEKNEKHIHLERKIIIFMDQPRTELLARLRPLLSHDKKTLTCKITDKTGQGGNKTKNIVIHGYPVAIFCTASSGLDEQEATRFLLLSPETHSEKFRETIHAKIQSQSSEQIHSNQIDNGPEQALLKERIEMIKNAHIDTILVPDPNEIEKLFLNEKKHLKPRHQRDIERFLSFIQIFALLNLPHRKRERNTLYAEREDILEAWKLWIQIAPGQEYNISPYLMDLYTKVFVPAYREYNKNRDDFSGPKNAIWVPRKCILQKHYEVYGRPLDPSKWRQEIEVTLENSGLLTTEKDGRWIIVSPVEEIDWNIVSTI